MAISFTFRFEQRSHPEPGSPPKLALKGNEVWLLAWHDVALSRIKTLVSPAMGRRPAKCYRYNKRLGPENRPRFTAESGHPSTETGLLIAFFYPFSIIF